MNDNVIENIFESRYPIGESGFYINPRQAIRRIDEWWQTTPVEVKNQQIENLALGLLFIGGILFFKSLQNRDYI